MRSKDGNNPHTHVLCTLRPVEGEGFGNKPDMSGKFNDRGNVGQGAKSDLASWRASWETHCNAALEAGGLEARIDHRSLKEQGIDREPEPKIGVEATAMQRRGAQDDPDRVRDARQVRMENELRSAMRDASAPDTGSEPETETTWFGRLKGAFAHFANEFRDVLRDESSGGRWMATRHIGERDAGGAASGLRDPAANDSPTPAPGEQEIHPPAVPDRRADREPEMG